MQDDVRISVCLAAYNGAAYIEEQLRSILPELGDSDEVIVVDDCSSDGTGTVVRELADPRIRLLHNEQNLGQVKTFERALGEATGDFLFLSDQDDIWLPGRVDRMLKALEEDLVVVSNCRHFGAPPGRFHQIRLRAADSRRHAANVLGIVVGYRLHWGCAMAMRAEFLNQALPFPGYMRESHDQWLAMAGNLAGSIRYLEEDTVLHRLHSDNVTPDKVRGLPAILRARMAFLANLMILLGRTRLRRS
ncbi:glycosyltransferase [Arthrobacter sp. APC 3897]|uniref:glycosyltransferase n=1 Tax=Arthrobacter sp. APC 3897 TaxID=3035204 RepID=UPI0025B445E9|nr:glycosyltransferase [Arthrobacter sp. APC 3897]MDN3481500.1 glycosyltransferase [Arthrobacter sp. APC 3897]